MNTGVETKTRRSIAVILVIAFIGASVALAIGLLKRGGDDTGRLSGVNATKETAKQTPEEILSEASGAAAANNLAAAQQATDKLLRLYPGRDIRADIEGAPQIRDMLLRSWSQSTGIVLFSSVQDSAGLGPNFKGTDFNAAFLPLYNMRSSRPERLETETKEDFEARYDAEYQRLRMIGPYAVKGLQLAFVGDKEGTLAEGDLAYDPSEQKFRWGRYNDASGKFEISKRFGPYSDSDWGAHIQIGSEEKDRGTYQGSNAFGVARTVQKTDYTINYLLFFNIDDFDWSKLSFNVAKEKVAEIKPQLRFMYAVEPIEPFGSITFSEKTPTISNPKEERSYWKQICSRLHQFWIIRIDTGEILARLEPHRPPENYPIQKVSGDREACRVGGRY